MLEGLMQHDYPLTLQLVLRRMRAGRCDDGLSTPADGEAGGVVSGGAAVPLDHPARGRVSRVDIHPPDQPTSGTNRQRGSEAREAVHMQRHREYVLMCL